MRDNYETNATMPAGDPNVHTSRAGNALTEVQQTPLESARVHAAQMLEQLHTIQERIHNACDQLMGIEEPVLESELKRESIPQPPNPSAAALQSGHTEGQIGRLLQQMDDLQQQINSYEAVLRRLDRIT